MNPLVSIIIPVYNSGVFLPDTLASVNEQSYKNTEVIIIDNGSNDRYTLEYLDNIKDKYQIIFGGKTGVSAARNTGINKANGTYILALDSDDIIKPTFIEKCVDKMLADSSISVVRTQIELFGKKKGELRFPKYEFSILLARNLMVVTSLFKKEEWKTVGGFDVDFNQGFEDWEFWINLLKNGGKVATIDDTLFKYRIRKGSRNSSLTQQDLKDIRKQIWKKHKDLFATNFVDPTESFEYKFMAESTANQVGNILMKPFSIFKLMK